MLRIFRCFFLIIAGWLSVHAQFPDIVSFSPRRGMPGTEVVISGSNLGSVNLVMIGKGAAAILSRTAVQLRVIVPPDATIGSIVVYNSWGQDISDLSFQVAPRITGFRRILPAPATPADAIRGVPGNVVEVLGANYLDPSDPLFRVGAFIGGVAAQVQYAAMTELGDVLQIVVPNGAVSGPITVTNNAGGFTTASAFYLQPVITGFSPSRVAVGDLLTVRGVSLLGASAVTFGNLVAFPESVTGTNVVVRIPALANDSPFSLTTPGGVALSTSNVILLPTVTNFVPAAGAPGTLVRIFGTGLRQVASVDFGGVRASLLTNISSGEVRAVVPPAALTGPLVVRTSGGTNVTGASFYVAPSITSFAPEQGVPGTQVVLTGVNFLGATEVRFGSTPAPAFVVDSNVRITVAVPNGAESGPIRVVGPGGTNTTVRFFQVLGQEPVISSFSPSSGPVGTQVQIRGFNLTGVLTVRFGGVAATAFNEVGGTNLTARVPTGAVTGPISVTTARGTGASTNSFIVGSTADVRVTLASGPASPAYGGEVSLTVRAENLGPLPAETVLLFLELPAGLDFQSAAVSQGTFETLGRAVTFRVGTVEPSATVTAVVQATVASYSPLSVTAEAAADTPDQSPGNNAAGVTVQAARPVLNLSRAPAGGLILSWPAEPTNLVAEGSLQLSGAPWVAVPGPIETVAGQRRAVVPGTNALEVFRLRLGP